MTTLSSDSELQTIITTDLRSDLKYDVLGSHSTGGVLNVAVDNFEHKHQTGYRSMFLNGPQCWSCPLSFFHMIIHSITFFKHLQVQFAIYKCKKKIT